jgi:hypothetical protein
MKNLIALVAFSFSFVLFGQDYTPPSNYKLKKASDYDKYEAEILKCIDWLEKTPINEKVAQHKEANAFFFTWISGSPTVSVTLYDYVGKFSEVYSQYLITFLGGGTKLILSDKSKKFSEEEIQFAGLKAVIEQYKNNPETKRDKLMTELAEMSEEDLLKWLQEQIKKK